MRSLYLPWFLVDRCFAAASATTRDALFVRDLVRDQDVAIRKRLTIFVAPLVHCLFVFLLRCHEIIISS
jgi:hypothetical protein